MQADSAHSGDCGKTSQFQLDSGGRIVENLYCQSCGHNLHGWHCEADCPECGLSIREAAKRPLLARLDPQWVKRLRLGLRWMNRAVRAALFLPLMVAAVIHLLMGESAPRADDVAFAAGFALALCSAMLAVWHFTARPPRQHSSALTVAFSRAAHWTAPPVACACIWLILEFALQGSAARGHWIAAIASPVGLLGGVVALAFSSYVKTVCALTGNKLAVRSAVQYRLLFGVSWLICLPGLLAVALGAGGKVAGLAAVSGGIGAGVSGILVLAVPTYLSHDLLRFQVIGKMDRPLDAEKAQGDSASDAC